MADKPVMPTGRLRRTTLPALLAARTGAALALDAARRLRKGDSAADLARDERLAKAATRAVRQMGEMKGAVMKIGQLLSFVDSSMVPEGFREALASLQADAPPMDYSLVADMVEAELGARPDEVFAWFSPRPMAAASIGQVHLARLVDGTELAVKVQYPGIADAVATDLRNGTLISGVVSILQIVAGPLMPSLDAKGIVDELRAHISEELDYRIEAKNQQEMLQLWDGDAAVRIPAVLPELSSERVITMEYVDGMRFAAAVDQTEQLRDAWGLAISRFTFGNIYRHGVFNADPHPGNYLFHEDGTVTFLDFGCVKRFLPGTVQAMRRLGEAVWKGTDDEMLQAFADAGYLKTLDGVDREYAIQWIRRNWEPVYAKDQPYRYSKEYAASQLDAVFAMKFGKAERSFMQQADIPPDAVFLLRITAGLYSVLAALEAAIDINELGPEIWP